MLAGILSVMGYSINDKIVVFDRVRENFRTLRKPTPDEMLNRSINQTLSRTIITVVRGVPDRAGAVPVRRRFAAGHGRGADDRHRARHAVVDLRGVPAADAGFLKVTKQDLMPKAKDEAALARRP